jgi:hypothetical protein
MIAIKSNADATPLLGKLFQRSIKAGAEKTNLSAGCVQVLQWFYANGRFLVRVLNLFSSKHGFLLVCCGVAPRTLINRLDYPSDMQAEYPHRRLSGGLPIR